MRLTGRKADWGASWALIFSGNTVFDHEADAKRDVAKRTIAKMSAKQRFHRKQNPAFRRVFRIAPIKRHPDSQEIKIHFKIGNMDQKPPKKPRTYVHWTLHDKGLRRERGSNICPVWRTTVKFKGE